MNITCHLIPMEKRSKSPCYDLKAGRVVFFGATRGGVFFLEPNEVIDVELKLLSTSV